MCDSNYFHSSPTNYVLIKGIMPWTNIEIEKKFFVNILAFDGLNNPSHIMFCLFSI